MKAFFKRVVVAMLVKRVRRLRATHDFKVVAVAGSIGKTSTKYAVAQLLGAGLRVRYQAGNYNDVVTVPLVFFGVPLPSLTNPLAWLLTFARIERQLHRLYPYDVVVIELGTDYPGMMQEFGYLTADIGVLTGVTPEHMEFFGSLDEVAKEELVLSDLATTLLVNGDLVDARYMPQRSSLLTYGIAKDATYKIGDVRQDGGERHFTLRKNGQQYVSAECAGIADVQLYSVSAAIAVADQLGLGLDVISKGIAKIQQVPGRLQILDGANGSTIIDDTYNASPEAVKFALKALYDMPGKTKVALLGNMNELGGHSASAHADIGALCDPTRLQLVVTVGKDANRYLADAAEKRGCRVVRCPGPYEAADAIRPLLAPDAVVLAKGSQNGVFAEEAVKRLLDNPADTAKLVRQSEHWLGVKRAQFPGEGPAA